MILFLKTLWHLNRRNWSHIYYILLSYTTHIPWKEHNHTCVHVDTFILYHSYTHIYTIPSSSYISLQHQLHYIYYIYTHVHFLILCHIYDTISYHYVYHQIYICTYLYSIYTQYNIHVILTIIAYNKLCIKIYRNLLTSIYML